MCLIRVGAKLCRDTGPPGPNLVTPALVLYHRVNFRAVQSSYNVALTILYVYCFLALIHLNIAKLCSKSEFKIHKKNISSCKNVTIRKKSDVLT